MFEVAQGAVPVPHEVRDGRPMVGVTTRIHVACFVGAKISSHPAVRRLLLQGGLILAGVLLSISVGIMVTWKPL